MGEVTRLQGRIMALTLWQPWASLLAMGEQVKAHETRNWHTGYRGPLLIHASRRQLNFGHAAIAESLLRDVGLKPPAYPLGAFIGIGLLTSCGPTDGFYPEDPANELDEAFGDWSPGRFAWRLANVLAFDPVPCPGQQGLREPPESIVDACLESARRAAFARFQDVPEVADHLIERLFPSATHPVNVDRD